MQVFYANQGSSVKSSTRFYVFHTYHSAKKISINPHTLASSVDLIVPVLYREMHNVMPPADASASDDTQTSYPNHTLPTPRFLAVDRNDNVATF